MYNRESRIMRKLLGKTVLNDAAAGESTVAGPAAATQTSYRPIKPQNAVYAFAAPISCLDVAADGRAAILGGPHILRTLVLDQAVSGPGFFHFGEGIDVRASITSQTLQKTSGSRANVVADQLNIRDVKWHDNGTVFTACATGRIFAYDLSRVSAGVDAAEPVDYIQMQEDGRQVNTLDVNPHLKSWLLSGSQDGIARVFDISAPVATRSGVLTFRQRFSPLKSNESIRKVMWSPRVGHEMACCTEGGVVLKWDVRQSHRPLLRINAHEKSCSTIAWHPDGIHLMSAGWDAKLHVWDLGASADKRQKPKWTINTPAPVSSLAWRPGLWSATAQTRRVAQVAVSYDESSNKRYGASVVHIWDLARPTMPYKEIERFDCSPAAMVWRDQDMLWTVGQDGLFNQCDVAYAPKSIDRLSTSAMAFSPHGEAVMFLDERPQQSRPRPIMHHSETHSRPAYSSSPRAQLLGGSKSDSEEDVLGTFIGPRRRTTHRRRLSGRTGQLLSTTPPYASNSAEDGGLDQSVNVTGTFRSQQVMASGKLPASTKVPVYQYLTASYLDILERMLSDADGKTSLAQRVGAILDKFAQASEDVRLYRLSQSWRVVAFAMDLLLKKRASYHFEARSSRFQKIQVDSGKSSILLKQPGIYGSSCHGEETPRRPSAHVGSFESRAYAVRSLLSEEIESTSNVPTSVARPVDTAKKQEWENGNCFQHGKMLTPILEPESFNIGPARHSYADAAYSPGGSQPVLDTSRESDLSELSITQGHNFYDTDTLAKAIDVPLPKSKEAADRHGHGTGSVRHDLEDSISEVFSLSDRTESLSLPSPAVDIAGTANNRSDSASASKFSSGQGSADTEYEPRIHGDMARHKSGAPNSPEDVFMISRTTASTNDAYVSQTSFTTQSDSDRNASFQQPAVLAETVVSREESSGNLPSQPPVPVRYDNDPRPHIIETDYYPWPDDPDFFTAKTAGSGAVTTATATAATEPAALDPYFLLRRAFEFECRSSAVNAAAMVLLLRPLLPDGMMMDSHLARGILRQHHKRLMGMGLFVEASWLRKLCVRGWWPEGMPEWWGRDETGSGPENYGYEYAAIFGPAQQGIKTGLLCSACRRPREIDPADGRDAVWTCERCRAVMDPCAVCKHRDAELPAHVPGSGDGDDQDDAWLSDWWWYCPGCAHGGHASCLQIWHGAVEEREADYDDDKDYNNNNNNNNNGNFYRSKNSRQNIITTTTTTTTTTKFSDGCCPLDGCGHACLPGRYRGEMMAARAEELSRAAALALDNVRASAMEEAIRGAGSGGVGNGSGNSRRSSPGRVGGDGSVRCDSHDVIPQSKAVGMARETLNNRGGSPGPSKGTGTGTGTGGGGAGGGGILSSSPAPAAGAAGRNVVPGTGERERRKSVKFVKTGR